MPIDWRWVQTRLKQLGFDPGPIDGIPGPQTDRAVIAFKESVGLRPRAFVGPMTLARLRDGIKIVPSDVTGSQIPVWLRLAYGYLGLREIPGARHNADIVGWWESLALPFRDDETPWCAGFVNAMIKAAGLPIPPKYRAAALGWRWTGYGKPLPGPYLGAVMSMTREGRPGSGHMTIVAGRDVMGRLMGLGGNQGNAVSINPYHPLHRDAKFHWPEGAPPPDGPSFASLPVISATGRVLENEA